ncbi:MAG: single-stranded DNA-binding protein, partial [Actinomycetota bacterium]|nr:single-stranded DNA-binding protein [Actinomycetota bacterium]
MTLRGNLVRDPELRYTKGGKAVCDARLAVNGDDDQTRFYTVTSWENQAEAVAQVCKKGDQLGARGRLEHRTWTGRDGTERSEDVLTAFVVELYRRKATGNGGAA